jgi:prepilin-type N-terminal cleavage/methylation domain-containing protein
MGESQGVPPSRSQSGMTLLEVMIASAVVLLMAGGLFAGIVLANQVLYSSSQRQAAFGLCMARFEQMHIASFSAVNSSNFPPQTLQLTHLGGSARVPLACTVSSTITPYSNPDRKTVRIAVAWNYRGKPMQETLDGVIFQKPEP